ncbi:hypothetical protein ACFQZC_24535 [Streptacidiphilus monticola]
MTERQPRRRLRLLLAVLSGGCSSSRGWAWHRRTRPSTGPGSPRTPPRPARSRRCRGPPRCNW